MGMRGIRGEAPREKKGVGREGERGVGERERGREGGREGERESFI